MFARNNRIMSKQTVANPNMILNTVVADVLSEFADKLENTSDLNKTMKELIVNTYNKHKRIVFNGNNYSDEWIKEAESRGLANISNTVDALTELAKDYSIELFTRHNVLTKMELESRCDIQLEVYRDKVFAQMSNVRNVSDTLETLIPSDIWPLPTYFDLLFRL